MTVSKYLIKQKNIAGFYLTNIIKICDPPREIKFLCVNLINRAFKFEPSSQRSRHCSRRRENLRGQEKILFFFDLKRHI